MIIFVTGNKNKLREARSILGKDVISEKLDLPEFQGLAKEIAKQKAVMASEIIGKPCFVDDTSLEFDALGGMPGPYIKDFIRSMGVKQLPRLLEGFSDKKATAVCTIGYCKPGKQPHVFEGRVRGSIVEARGRQRFGWDPIFKPVNSKKTYAEMSAKEINLTSHRKKAFEKFLSFIR